MKAREYYEEVFRDRQDGWKGLTAQEGVEEFLREYEADVRGEDAAGQTMQAGQLLVRRCAHAVSAFNGIVVSLVGDTAERPVERLACFQVGPDVGKDEAWGCLYDDSGKMSGPGRQFRPDALRAEEVAR